MVARAKEIVFDEGWEVQNRATTSERTRSGAIPRSRSRNREDEVRDSSFLGEALTGAPGTHGDSSFLGEARARRWRLGDGAYGRARQGIRREDARRER